VSKRARVRATLRDGRIDWYRIENRADDTAAVHIYDEIGFFGVTAADFVKDFTAIKASSIDVHVNSPGGEVFDGVAIHNAIKNHPANVTVRIDGLAASAASFIAMAGDQIVIEKNAQMMIHDALSLAVGNAAELRDLADMLDKTSESIAQMYADRAGGDAADWRKAMKAETWYSAQEAVDAGLADEVAGAKDDEGKAGLKVAASFDLSIFRHAGREAAPAPVAAVLTDEPVPHSGVCVADVGEDNGFAVRAVIPEHGPECIVDELPVAAPVAFDAALLRTAVLAANDRPHVDTGTFRDAMTAAAADAPAPPQVQPAEPTPEPVAEVLEDDEETPEDTPGFDPDVLSAAVHLAANDAPAPPEPPAFAIAPPEPVFAFDPDVFLSSLKEAKL
jgi:ATP-dependent protease ClpP protease subunit